MPPPQQGQTTRKRKPAALRRSGWLKVRVSQLETTAIQAQADAAGLTVSEYVRRMAIGGPAKAARPRASREQKRRQQAVETKAATEQERREQSERRAPGDFDAVLERIKAEQPGLPERNARILASRELTRG